MLYQKKPVSLTKMIHAIAWTDLRGRRNHSGNKASQERHTGRRRGYVLTEDGGKGLLVSEMDLIGTIRTAAPWQIVRQSEIVDMNQGESGLALEIHRGDICRKRYVSKPKIGVLFVVDASRSQGAQKRLAFAKGAVLSLLKQVYSERYQAGLIIFGHRRAELVLPFTKSVEYAAKSLRSIPAVGNTPLAMGIRKAIETIEMEKKKDEELYPMVVLITDGQGNYDVNEGDPMELAFQAAKKMKDAKVASVVIDTERQSDMISPAKQLAEEMGALYLTLESKIYG